MIEIPTPAGLAYAQFTHLHRDRPAHGALLRVLPGLFAARPQNFTELVQQEERFLCFFPLGAACHRGIVRVVAAEAIPARAALFPVFRDGSADNEGKVKTWFVWDGKHYQRVEELTPEIESLPLHPGVWNDTLLVDRIVTGWRPEGAA